MTTQSMLLLAAFLLVLLALAWPLGLFMAHVAGRDAVPGMRLLAPVERLSYRAAGPAAAQEQGWRAYAVALLLFNGVGALFTYGVQRLQGMLPLNPQALPGVSPDSSFNTAVSFVANTNGQG